MIYSVSGTIRTVEQRVLSAPLSLSLSSPLAQRGSWACSCRHLSLPSPPTPSPTDQGAYGSWERGGKEGGDRREGKKRGGREEGKEGGEKDEEEEEEEG